MRLAEGSSTPTQSAFLATIGMIRLTPLIVGASQALG